MKSTVGVSLYILWRIYRNANIRILVGTNIKRLARALIRELRQYLEDEELQQLVWNVRPHVEGALVPALDAAGKRRRNAQRSGSEDENEALDKKVIWSSEAIQVIRSGKFKEPTVAAVSALTTMTGDHYDLVILDDVVDFKNSDQPGKREKIMQWALDLESILDPQRVVTYGTVDTKNLYEVIGDEVLITGTRYYDGDYYGNLLSNLEELQYRTFIRNVYKNGRDNTDGYLWDEKFNHKTVQKLRKRLTPRQFAAQYLNEIMTDEERIFKQESIKWIHAERVKVSERKVYIRLTDEEQAQHSTMYGTLRTHIELRPLLVIDPAISQSSSADYTVLAVGGYDTDGKFYLIDLRAGRWLPSETINKMWELVEKWQLAMVHVETGNGLGLSLVHAIKESFTRKKKALVVKEVKPGTEKKEARIQDNLEPLFANVGYFNATSWTANVPEFKDEIDFYPRSAHDDVLDAVAWIAKLATRIKQRDKLRNGKALTRKTSNRVNKYYGGVR